MKSNQRSPVLPYLGVLACLFALSVLAPRSWRSGETPSKPATAADLAASTFGEMPAPVQPAPIVVPLSSEREAPPQFVPTPESFELADLSLEPITAVAAERVADQPQFELRGPEMSAALALVPEPPTEIELEPRLPAPPPEPAPVSGHMLESNDLEPNDTGIEEPDFAAIEEAAVAAWWPAPEALLRRLESLASHQACRMWAREAIRLIGQLDHAASPEDPLAAKVLADLHTLNSRVPYLISDRYDAALAAELRRARYALSRRLDIWRNMTTDRSAVASLGNPLHRPAIDRDNARALLAAIEQYENGCKPSSAEELATWLNELGPYDPTRREELRQKLEVHYRNANVRIAVSGDFLNRILPQPDAETDRVVDTVVGVPVRGHSTTSTQLHLRLLPHASQLRFGLEALGDVDSFTRATSGPVTFHNAGDASFLVRKLIVVDAAGVRVKAAQAQAQSSTGVAGLETNFDGIPLLGDMVRSYAMSEHQSKQGQAKREVETKVAIRALGRFDSEVNSKIGEAERLCRQRLSRLGELALDLTPVQLETTAERMQMRLRLSGKDQLGAHTARPRAPATSLLSAQLHQTAINNFVERLDLHGRTFTVPELHAWVSHKLQRSLPALPDESPHDVEVTFAEQDPLVVHCDDGLLVIHLQFARFRHERKSWRDVGMRAAYTPAPRGLSLLWERDGTVELTGERYEGRTEFALRGILSKIFPKDRPLDLTPAEVKENARLAGLAITQCIAEDGWIGLAIGPAHHGRPANLSLEAKAKVPRVR